MRRPRGVWQVSQRGRLSSCGACLDAVAAKLAPQWACLKESRVVHARSDGICAWPKLVSERVSNGNLQSVALHHSERFRTPKTAAGRPWSSILSTQSAGGSDSVVECGGQWRRKVPCCASRPLCAQFARPHCPRGTCVSAAACVKIRTSLRCQVSSWWRALRTKRNGGRQGRGKEPPRCHR
jgi:hypothetical protein